MSKKAKFVEFVEDGLFSKIDIIILYDIHNIQSLRLVPW